MKIINKGLLKSILALTLGLLFILLPATVSQGSIRRYNPTPSKPRQDKDTMRGTFRQTAQRFGRRDGIKAGRQDRGRGEPSNFRDESDYQAATNGYNSKLGDKSHYQQVYRTAYENGYNDGYNGY
jgi:hypothetical protein